MSNDSSFVSRLISIQPGEGRIVAWAWLYLFSVFTSYYVIRPIRDEAGVAGGVNNLSWLFTGTLLAMIAVNPPFAAMVRRLPRVRFIGLTYRFFILNLLIFLVLFKTSTGSMNIWVGRAFFIWTSVFNLFVVSVFWAFMVDIFTASRGKRLFGFIAAAATVGGILGALVTATTVRKVGVPALLLLSAALLEVGVFASRRLSNLAPVLRSPVPGEAPQSQEDAVIGGGIMAGLTNTLRSPYLLNICLYMLLYTILSTFLYFQQASIVDKTFADRASRTTFFAQVDLFVNVLTLFGQFFLTGRVMARLGVPATLTFVPALTAAGFLLLGMMPMASIVVGFTALRRVGNFSFARPTREVLFTVVSREDKYKTKNFVDTVVYRLGDQVGAWSSTLINSLGMGISAVAWTAVPLGLLWVGNAWWLGREQERRSAESAAAAPLAPAGIGQKIVNSR